jgi:hypothetical protein
MARRRGKAYSQDWRDRVLQAAEEEALPPLPRSNSGWLRHQGCRYRVRACGVRGRFG